MLAKSNHIEMQSIFYYNGTIVNVFLELTQSNVLLSSKYHARNQIHYKNTMAYVKLGKKNFLLKSKYKRKCKFQIKVKKTQSVCIRNVISWSAFVVSALYYLEK